jgi:hypothetical protein
MLVEKKEKIISPESAKLAQKLGFNIITEEMYGCNAPEDYNETKYNIFDDFYLAPTLSTMQNWLIENQNIYVRIDITNVPIKKRWYYEIQKIPSGILELWNETKMTFSSYEEALDEGIKYTLKILNKKL